MRDVGFSSYGARGASSMYHWNPVFPNPMPPHQLAATPLFAPPPLATPMRAPNEAFLSVAPARR